MSVQASAQVDAELDRARTRFRRELLDAGLLIETSVLGLYGRSGSFERIVEGIDSVIRRICPVPAAKTLRFPPVYPRAGFERTDYIASFPDLTGALSVFTGDDRAHAELLNARSAGQPWDAWLHPADTVLVPAACHPAFAGLTGTLPPDGELLDVYGYCFRHEPSVDPARMQAFRQHEIVRVGTAEQARTHRDYWVQRGQEVLALVELAAQAVPANDPFFGRAGRLLGANQRAENLKTELVVSLYDDLDAGTAVVSCNCHEDHFGRAFTIATADGEVAHSACVGFGVERIALALLRTHGLDLDGWPRTVRAALAW
jgi:seryl-tRNA synthetase